MKCRLIIGIVPHNCGDIITGAARDAGAGGGTVLMGRGTADNAILQFLGLGETWKDVTCNVVTEACERGVKDAIIQAASHERKHFGILFTLDVTDFSKSGDAKPLTAGDSAMNSESAYKVINVIVNKGYAEDAMAAARKAGARGGTVLGARGTAKENDAQFFGVKLVPEKEMLMIIAENEKADAVFEAIRALPCFAEKGSGIEFTIPVHDFVQLGGANA